MTINIATGFFLPVPPVSGGATEKIWHRLAQEFARPGHAVRFYSRAWPGFPERETQAGVEHVRLRGADHTRSLPLNLWHDFWWGVRVARALDPADVTICNIVTLPPWLGRFRRSAGRVVAVVARMPKGQGRAFHRVDLVFSLSQAVTDKLCAENPALANRIVPFPFPIDWQLHAPYAAARAARRATATPLTIGYVGRIHPEKGLDVIAGAAELLAARRDLPEWQLRIIGPTSIPQGGLGEAYAGALRQRLQRALGNRVAFLGPEFDPVKLARHYGEIDVFCYPSLAEKGETFGVAIAEAMAAGCAPVVSDLACFADLVRPGDTGLVFRRAGEQAASQLADALGRLLVDVSLRTQLGRAGHEFARRFDYSESARSVLATLTKLVSNGAHER